MKLLNGFHVSWCLAPAFSYSRRESFEFLAVLFVAGIVFSDFCPEIGRVVHMIKMRKLVKDDVVAQRFWYLHETDIERNSASR